MCGVVALRSWRPGDDLRAQASRGLEAIRRRGPDGQGLVLETAPVPTALGHRRLSILDLSTAAEQPMRCPLSGNLLAFNGEIYNFLELRRELQALGHVFHTDSDSEVLLQGWLAWGEGLFQRCNGMWALVLWERASGDLVYCRDRLGVKPLYLHHDGQRLMLASEIGAIAAMLGGYPRPDPQAAFDFLCVGLSDHGGRTFFDGIRAVQPGWVHRLDRHGRGSARPYHQWPQTPQPAPSADELQALVEDAIRVRLRADVPTVSLLSGGLDSSIITTLSLAAGNLPRTCFAGAFTYGYLDELGTRFDETEAAARLMRGLGREAAHHVQRVATLPDEDELQALVVAQGEPFCTPSILASFRMYRAIRQAGYKVVLSGEGADELFGGYIKLYQALAARDALHAGRAGQVLRAWRDAAFEPRLLLNRLSWDLPTPLLGRLLRRQRPSVACIADGLWHAQQERFAALREDRRASLDGRMRADVLRTNLPMVLRMTDRNSMHFGVEVRSPFIDYRLVERMLATPAQTRMGDRRGKGLLRDAFAGRLPEAVLQQRKSTGFGHAEQFLVQAMPWRQALDALPEAANEFIDVGRLRAELARGNGHSTLWLALSFAFWYRSLYA
ncbi:asparagine synthase (glutamine-hydrolyzing) [Pseudomonas panipatensis]|uniref:asparagine synthase (glutamine-hydrolyzing) n=1 Tax=Pseudomonas panipatensis TaxID=428992 RepID=A0A1G8LDI1_9PSED|nr:asparagine synthase (glutamine-hydrolyzing) [Pseudomonas panipatensis]SDI53527.1 asparagine synthase (glutamine-hydrolysing) [Pseudomonas panipatensis]SMP75151.1 asparagine synthase (glutamine-hydrolysing) [Pseudomonas panipatensis]